MHYPLLTETASFDAVILANGSFPTASLPLTLLRQAPYVCACDGAVCHYPEADAVVGDGDSVPEAFRSKLIQVTEQEDNDLTKATRHCLSLGFRRILYLGCSGKREDHTLGNISLMVRYLRDFGIQPLMVTDDGWFTPAYGCATFDSCPRQQVSIFNFGFSHIHSKGLLYKPYAYAEWWQGTLNEAAADTFTLDADGYYLVYRTYIVE
ncbi:MAG: thiamine diphosphokinase [Bacteroidaceae bacterium]|nr:thiamine diphosphokinase [Bacteroidaceae bacterium]